MQAKLTACQCGITAAAGTRSKAAESVMMAAKVAPHAGLVAGPVACRDRWGGQ